MEDNFELSKLTKKKRLNSKTKGNTFQRKVAKLFNERFNTTEFCPTPGSGAFATTHNLPDYLKISGDLITPKNFLFCIECKKGSNKENLSSLFNPKSDFWGFWEQAKRDAEASKKFPLLVIQQDRQKILTVTTDILEEKEILSKDHICIIRDGISYLICELSDLFELADVFFLE